MSSGARAQVCLWMREAIEGQTIVKIPDLKSHVVDCLMAAEQEVLRSWLADSVDALAYDYAQRFCARTRGHVVFGDDIIARDAIATVAKARRPKWQLWLEQTSTKHIRLFDMMKRELLEAAEIREQRGQTEYQYAALWRELANGLNDLQSVKEVFSEEQIDSIAASLRVRVRARRVEAPQLVEAAD